MSDDDDGTTIVETGRQFRIGVSVALLERWVREAESMKLVTMKRNGATTGSWDRKVSPQLASRGAGKERFWLSGSDKARQRVPNQTRGSKQTSRVKS
jgi:hypothetical protein